MTKYQHKFPQSKRSHQISQKAPYIGEATIVDLKLVK